MKRKFQFTLGICLAFLLVIIPSVHAEIGITDTEIHIGQWGPQTGPAAAWGCLARGSGDYFKWINDNGGINGRKIVYHQFDDAYNPAKTIAGVKALQEGTGIFGWVGGVGTSCGIAVKDYLMEKKVPWVGPATGTVHLVQPPQKYLFNIYPVLEALPLVKYAVEEMGKKRVAIAYLNDEFGKGGLRGAIQVLKEHNMELVAQVPVGNTDTDMKPHIMKLKNANPDMVLLYTTVSQSVMLVGTAKAMHFSTQFMTPSACSDPVFMDQISRGLWAGVISSTFAEPIESNNPGIAKYKKDVYEKYATKGERFGLFYLCGILLAEPMVEGLKNAGPDLTREGFVTAMENIKGFKGIGPEINYKPFDTNDMYSRQGTNKILLIRALAGGKSEIVSDWYGYEH